MSELAERLERASHHGAVMRFSIHSGGQGFVIASSEANIRLLCDVYNARREIADAIRAQAHRRSS